MSLETRAELVKTKQLTEEQSRQTDVLLAACREHDGLDFDLYIDPSFVIDERYSSLILFYVQNELVGIVSFFVGDSLEVQGMVHPAHRRCGIGSALIESARSEAKLRGMTQLLLVCDGASLFASAFATALGAKPAFCETLMEFDPSAVRSAKNRAAPPEKRIRLEAVRPEQPQALLELCAAANDEPIDVVRPRIEARLAEPNQRFFVGTLPDGAAVGMLRVASFDDTVYINSFSVLPELRGRGYGRQMLDAIIDTLSEQGKPIRLEVESQNRNALSLYLSSGFKEVTSYQYYALSA